MAKINITGSGINQVACGENIRQVVNVESQSERKLVELLKEIKQSVVSDEKGNADTQLLKVYRRFESNLRDADPNQDEIRRDTEILLRQRPSVQQKLESLITGAGGNLLAQGIVQAIKLALGT